MKDKNRKLFHKLLDIVLDKEPESGVEVNVSSLDCTSGVWIFKMKDENDIVKMNAAILELEPKWNAIKAEQHKAVQNDA